MRPESSTRRQWLRVAAAWPAVLQAQTEPLSLGVVPNVSARVLVAQYQPLRNHLEATLARPVQVVTAPDFATFHDRATEGQYELFVTVPNLGALALADERARLLGITEPGIPALAVAPREQAAGALAALRGHKLALANPASLVVLRGLAWLREQGLEEGRDFEAVRAPNEDSLARWLDSGDAPLALMSRGEFNQLSESRRAALAVVQQFALLPGLFVMVPLRLPAAQAEQLQQLLLGYLNQPAGEPFRSASGLRGLRELARSDLAQIEPFVPATRRALAALR